MNEKDVSTTNAPPQPLFSKRYRNYVLFALTGVYTFNFIDRQILVVLAPYIKVELSLTDTHIGALTGLAFALIYVTLGIPVARWADRSNRKNITAGALAVWSAMTALSGLAANFFQLLMARIGVGVGEAGGSPPAHSMISDYFPREKRGKALGIYSSGVYIGILLGYLGGGIIASMYGWRNAFFFLGIPGLFYALLIYFTVKEPPKGYYDGGQQVEKETSFWEVFRILFSKKTFVFIAFACGFHTFGTYGIGNFSAVFFEEVHGMEKLNVAIGLAVTSGFGGILGSFVGGILADRLGKKDLRWYLWISVAFGLLSMPFTLMFIFSGNANLAMGTNFFTTLLTAAFLGPSLAVTHSLVNAKMRAMASAVLFFFLNLIGLGLGPLTLGILSDYLNPTYGSESIRWAFTFVFVTGGISVILFYLASKTYRRELGMEK